jgi:hypothetical protein
MSGMVHFEHPSTFAVPSLVTSKVCGARAVRRTACKSTVSEIGRTELHSRSTRIASCVDALRTINTGQNYVCYEVTRLRDELLTSDKLGVRSLGGQIVYDCNPCSMHGSNQPFGGLKLDQVSRCFFSVLFLQTIQRYVRTQQCSHQHETQIALRGSASLWLACSYTLYEERG